MKASGVDTGKCSVLHVRTFLDHDRPYITPAISPCATDGARCAGVYVKPEEGTLLSPALVMRSLIEHFERWASILEKEDHMVILEVHAMSAEAAGKHRHTSVSLNFDATQGFSGQMLVPAPAFLVAAAQAALHPQLDTVRWPSHEPYTRITLNCFVKGTYRIRCASARDLPALVQLERDCWVEHLQQEEAVLQKRLEYFPEGQLVLEVESSSGGWKLAVSLYTQRLSSAAQLENVEYCDLSSLHQQDGPLLQLLSIQTGKDHANSGYGGVLRDHALTLASLDDSIQSVVGVTRCRAYGAAAIAQPGLSMENHIEKGDRGVQFHTAKGALTRQVIPNFRPEDVENDGTGVLIEYVLRGDETEQDQGQSVMSADISELVASVFDSIFEDDPQNPNRQPASMPFMELGLDSFDMSRVSYLRYNFLDG